MNLLITNAKLDTCQLKYSLPGGASKTKVSRSRWGFYHFNWKFQYKGIHFNGISIPCFSLNLLSTFLKDASSRELLKDLPIFQANKRLPVSLLNLMSFLVDNNLKLDAKKLAHFYKVILGSKKNVFKKHYRLRITSDLLDPLLKKKGFLNNWILAAKSKVEKKF